MRQEDNDELELNLIMVVTFFLAPPQMAVEMIGISQCRLLGTVWTLIATVIAVMDVAFLLALPISCNWPRCNQLGDCPLGMECVRILGSSTIQEPLCNDCYYLVDAAPPAGSGAPWGHVLADEKMITAASARRRNYEPLLCNLALQKGRSAFGFAQQVLGE